MRYFFPIILTLILTIPSLSIAEQLISPERQREIIEAYQYVTGHADHEATKELAEKMSLDERVPLKCGTSAAMDFVLNFRNLDKDLLAEFSLDSTLDRPDLPQSLISPRGYFMIHYAIDGPDSAYQSSMIGSSGAPLFIEKMADILDSVYIYTMDTLGYSPPPDDSFYPKGGGPEYDIYVHDLGGAAFGLTRIDSISVDGPGSIRATSFIELDNDYQEITIYANRPLDAVRVTGAHEFFHAVQFGIDFTESENWTELFSQRYWMEMSATWMEEEQYDHINDYYWYLPSFFSKPGASIQQFNSFVDLHPYGSMIFPLYLSERFGRDVIREIWMRCANNVGPDFLLATEAVIDSVTAGAETYTSVFAEFTLWNYFTGNRAVFAPPGVGYSERISYPAFPDSEMEVNLDYPMSIPGSANPRNPTHNSAYYVQLNELSSIRYDTTYWNCTATGYTTCTDSTEVIDPGTGYEFIFEDTSFWLCNSGIYPSCADSTEIFDGSAHDFIHLDTTYWNCNAGTGLRCVDSVKVVDTTAGYEFVAIDSLLKIYNCLDPISYRDQWGLSIVTRPEASPNTYSNSQFVLPPGESKCDSLGIIDPHYFRSIVLIYTPASSDRRNYGGGNPIEIGLFIFETGVIDSSYIDRPASALVPFPNPAVVAEMEDEMIYFRFQFPTNASGFTDQDELDDAYVLIDIFTIAGEKVVSLGSESPDWSVSNPVRGDLRYGWDMKNERGAKVASGVYLAYARLFSEAKDGVLLAEDKAKIVIVR